MRMGLPLQDEIGGSDGGHLGVVSGVRDYLSWYEQYDDLGSSLSRRLALVREVARAELDAARAGPGGGSVCGRRPRRPGRPRGAGGRGSDVGDAGGGAAGAGRAPGVPPRTSSAHGIKTGAPALTTTTVLGFAAATARTISSCLPGSAGSAPPSPLSRGPPWCRPADHCVRGVARSVAWLPS